MQRYNKNRSAPEEELSVYGGYESRARYEKKKGGRVFWLLARAALFAVLMGLATVGVFSLLQTGVEGDVPQTQSGSSIKVPIRSEASDQSLSPAEMIRTAMVSVVTVEVTSEGGTVEYGSGFFISDDGYALCCDSLFPDRNLPVTVQVHTYDEIAFGATLVELDRALGFALLKVESGFDLTPVNMGNFTFVDRGDTLYVAGSELVGKFYGTLLSGTVASSGVSAEVIRNGQKSTVSVTYLAARPNPTVFGAPVFDETGRAVGFCTHRLDSPHGTFVAAVSISTVLTIVNEMLK
ncbi:MAG: trypsin-like peptidase domain-containing protein [Clostridia bacterium]|nr:trypsin-like peptidase domain-containing protein [Clostridia bacterium]